MHEDCNNRQIGKNQVKQTISVNSSITVLVNNNKEEDNNYNNVNTNSSVVDVLWM